MKIFLLVMLLLLGGVLKYIGHTFDEFDVIVSVFIVGILILNDTKDINN